MDWFWRWTWRLILTILLVWVFIFTIGYLGGLSLWFWFSTYVLDALFTPGTIMLWKLIAGGVIGTTIGFSVSAIVAYYKAGHKVPTSDKKFIYAMVVLSTMLWMVYLFAYSWATPLGEPLQLILPGG